MTPDTFDNHFLASLADPAMAWEKHVVTSSGRLEYRAAVGGGSSGSSGAHHVYALPSDMLLRYEPETMALVQEFAADAHGFGVAFAEAWGKLMASDRFEGAVKRVC